MMALVSGDTGLNWRLGALALLLVGSGWVRELVINGFYCVLNSLGFALLAFFAWGKGISLLGCVPEK